jgi:hypothetical protein
MALPLPPNNLSSPAPRTPFYSNPETYLQGPFGPILLGSTLCVNSAGFLNVSGCSVAGVSSLLAGPGIALSGATGAVTVCTNLVAGTNIALTPSGNQITISSTGGGVGTVTSIIAGAGLSGGTITTSGTIALTNTGVVAATYTNSTVAIDAQGRITSASSGAAIPTITGTYPIQVSSICDISINTASTTAIGAVQLTDSTSSTSITTAATPNSVRNAYNLASIALPLAGGTLSGGLCLNSTLVDSVNSPGLATYVLKSTGTGILWGANTASGVVGVTGSSPITVNNTDATNPVICINAASVSQSGAVQLTDCTSSISITTAATPNSVRNAYNLANNALPLVGGTMTGTIISRDICVPVANYICFNGGVNGCINGISNATSLIDSHVAASLTAVNTAYNLADAALPKSGGTMTGGINLAAAGVTFSNTSQQTAISDSVSLTSSTTAASSTAVKAAYDLTVTALQKTGGTMTGVIVFDSAQTFPISGIQDATTAQKGVVQLTDSVSSTSITTAATPNSVKSAYDLANGALQKTGGTMSGQIVLSSTGVQFSDATQLTGISDSVSLTSSIIAASAAAVRVAYDLANAALPKAGGTLSGTVTFATAQVFPVSGIQAGTTSQVGVVQLVDSFVSSSTTTAATPNSVRNAYNLASAALPFSGGTMTGPISFFSSQIFPNATITTPGVVTVGSNIAVTSGGIISVLNASTTQSGVVQLNDTSTSTSTTEALTAAQGKALQDQINALATSSNITLAGTYNASTGLVGTVTDAGLLAGFVSGSALPAAATINTDFFVIVEVSGSTGPAGTPPYSVGDWFLSSGTTWFYLSVGFQAAYATTTTDGLVRLATDAQTQAGTDATPAITPSSLQSKISDSISTTSTTTIASSTAVKTAYDLANAALPKAGGTMTGIIVFQDVGEGVEFNDSSFMQGISNSISTTSSTTAASSTAVKTVQLTAAAALPMAGGTMTGAITFVAGQTFPIAGIDIATVSSLGVVSIGTNISITAGGAISVAAGSTTVVGVLQLTDSINSTSITTAATPNSVKTAYDLANTASFTATAALPKAGGTMTGDIVFNAGQTFPISGITIATTSTLGVVSVGTNINVTAGGSISVQAGTTTQVGVVQLNDSITSTSTTLAATANSVKQVHDLVTAAQATATAALPKAGGTMTGAIVLDAVGVTFNNTSQLTAISDSASSTSSIVAASSTAVKAAYDLANVALPLAGGTMSGDITFHSTQTFPVSGIADATTSTKGIVEVGSNINVASGVISVASGSTSALGVVQLNNTVSSTSTALALTAAQGKVLQDQITALAITSNITLAGTFNASTGLVDSVTTAGTGAGFVVGSALPTASAGNNGYFVIVDVQGSTGPTGTPPYHVGDWFLSSGTAWQFLNIGYAPGQATTTSQGVVLLATNAEVQAGTDTAAAVVSSSLQSKVSDSTSTTSSTTIASSTAVSSAYALANEAMPRSGGDFTGPVAVNNLWSFNVTPIYADPAQIGDAVCVIYSNTTSGLTAINVQAAIDEVSIKASALATPTVAGNVYGCVCTENTSIGCYALCSITTGIGNVAMGPIALCSTTTGTSNTAFGYATLCGNTTGCYNTGVGTSALAVNSTGIFNTSVGSSALENNTSGSNNTAIGANASTCATTGTLNTSIGSFALFNTTDGSNNTANGACALYQNVSGANNVATGGRALLNNTSGSCNTASGAFSLCCNTTGCHNTAYGDTAGYNITTGCYNVAIGSSVGVASPTGSCQLAIGFSTGCNWITGTNTKAIKLGGGLIDCNDSCGTAGQVLMSNGSNAICWGTAGGGGSPATPIVSGTVYGCTNSSGVLNTALGYQTLIYNTSGCCNVAIGANALYCNTTGGQNVAIGSATLYSNTLGRFNTATGADALVRNILGCFNVATGFCALCSNVNGCYNVASGYHALFCSTGGSNTAYGACSGYNITTGSCNVTIGYCAQVADNTIDNQLAIGIGSNNWLTGTASFNIKPGAGIVDCTGSAGSDLEVLYSTGGNGVVWAQPAGGLAATPYIFGGVYGCTITDSTSLGKDALSLLSTGTYNTVVGSSAAVNTTTGCNNTIVGNYAFNTNTTGNDNTAVGRSALFANTTGIDNIAIGISALQANTTGSCNTAIGTLALASSTTANSNIAIGYYSSRCITTGTGNISIGLCSSFNNTTGKYNTGLGTNTLKANIIGCNSTAVGYDALAASTGDLNNAFGAYALQSLTTGTNNVAIGICALHSSVAGCCNIAIGNNSLSLNTSIWSVAIGTDALKLSTVGGGQVAIGNAALAATTTGTGNTAVGFNALTANTTGVGNVAMGSCALIVATSGRYNTAVGRCVAVVLTTGCCNTAVGFRAHAKQTTGNGNVAFGANAGCNITEGSFNTALGTGSMGFGSTLITGCSNTAIGSSTLASATTACFNTIVGEGGGFSISTGTYNTGVGSAALYCTSTGISNAALGENAGGAISTGRCNIAIGYRSMGSLAPSNNVTGCENIGIGSCALCVNASGNHNTAIGPSAGIAITTGCTNLALGCGAQVALATGSCQLAIGFSTTQNWLTGNSTKAIKPGAGIIDCANSCGTAGQVLMSNGANAICWGAAGGGSGTVTSVATGTGLTGGPITATGTISLATSGVTAATYAYATVTVDTYGRVTSASNGTVAAATPTTDGIIKGCTTSSNTSLGCNALVSNTTSVCNVAIGLCAMGATTSGSEAVAVGYHALAANTTGASNTAVGALALQSNTTGNFNQAFGYGSLACNTTGGSNTAYGFRTLGNNTTGDGNVATGSMTLYSNTTGRYNTGDGYQALTLNTTGCYNTAVGGKALSSSTTGTSNASVGAHSLHSSTTANINTAMGVCAMYCNTTGSNNTAFGYDAMFHNLNGLGNTGLGPQAMYNNTSGNYNTGIGYCALGYNTTGCNVIAIGCKSGGPNSPGGCLLTTSNTIVMGNNSHTAADIRIAWTVTSDIRDKAIDPAGVPYGLNFVNQIEPIAYSFCDRTTNEVTDDRKRFGFSAQNLLALETETESPVIIGDTNPDELRLTDQRLLPVLVNAIKELSAKNDALEARLAALEG